MTENLLRAAGIDGPVPAGGRAVTVEATPAGTALRLRARLASGAGATVSGELLSDIELAAPGDTRLVVDAGGLSAIRTVVEADASSVHAAVHSLASVLAGAVAGSDSLGTIATVNRYSESVGPPVFPEHADEAVLRPFLDGFRTVATPQDCWAEPDATQPPIGQLRAGTCYPLVELRQDWANVKLEDGRGVWTDARSLRRLSEVDPGSLDVGELPPVIGRTAGGNGQGYGR